MGRSDGAAPLKDRYLFDTDSLSLYFHDHPILIQRFLAHTRDEIAVSVITIEEVLTGWYAALRRARKPHELVNAYDRLTETMCELRNWDVISFNSATMVRYQGLKTLRLNLGSQDVRIGAIAIEWDAVVVTRNLRDFRRLPGLRCEDWSV